VNLSREEERTEKERTTNKIIMFITMQNLMHLINQMADIV
jgi:hypothetical protein